MSDDVSVDAYKDNRYTPKLRIAVSASMSVLDFWLLFFPSESIGEILQETNARLKSRQKRITKGELYKAIRLLYMLRHLPCGCPQATSGLLATARADDLFPTPAFGVQSEWVELALSKYWQLFLLVQLMMAQTRGLQQLQGHSSTYICASA